MLVVGLLGGVASGKTLVASQLCQLGAQLLDGDRAGHEVLRMHEVKCAIRQRWGDEVFDEQGEVDRGALARIVFAASAAGRGHLEYLESLTHPKIADLLRRQAAQLEASGAVVAVLDAAVMLKAGWQKMCDKILFVESPRSQRAARSMTRGWSEEDFEAREAVQESLDEKRGYADLVIDNAGSPEATYAQVEKFWRSLISWFPPPPAEAESE